MVAEIIDTNMVEIVGQVTSEEIFSHEIFGENFYIIEIKSPRLSDTVDILPIRISEKLLVNVNTSVGEYLKIEGQLRSYNRYIDNSNRLILTIFAKTVKHLRGDELEENLKEPNRIYLDGYICKKPVYRKTPFGREITDLLLAVNRLHNKSDYIPTISWGRNAKDCEKMIVGDRIKLWGRIQSREYKKTKDCGEVEKRVAFEVSVSELQYIEDYNNRL